MDGFLRAASANLGQRLGYLIRQHVLHLDTASELKDLHQRF